MNRMIKEATVKRYHYDSHDQLRQHLQDFIDAYNFAVRLKRLERSDTLSKLLQMLDFKARSVHHQSDPSNAGIEHAGVAGPAMASAPA